MSELKKNVTSSWIKAASRFGHTPKKPIVMFYVEGDDDIPFWEEAVKLYHEKYNIQVRTNKAINPKQGNGKAILMRMEGLGPNKVVAVDADFDLIIDGYSDYTNMVRSAPYVVNTTWYSVENILMQKTQSVSFLEAFSIVFKNLFIDFLKNVKLGVEKQPTIGFGKLLQSKNIQKLANNGDFSSISDDVVKDCQNDAIKNKLADMGYEEANLWKLMRGHNLWNTIVKPIEEKLLNKKIKEQVETFSIKEKGCVRNKVMEQLGITCSVKDYIENSFYNKDLHLIQLPNATRDKLNQIFV